MGVAPVVAFAGLAAVAAYVQTLTGFAFGLVMMGAIALVGLLPLPDAAAMVGMLTLVNATQMLIQGGWREVAQRELRLILIASLPSLFLGYAVLEWLADTRADLLKVGLGLSHHDVQPATGNQACRLGKTVVGRKFRRLRRHFGPDERAVRDWRPAARLSFLSPANAARTRTGNAGYRLRRCVGGSAHPRGRKRQPADHVAYRARPRHTGCNADDLCGAALAAVLVARDDAKDRLRPAFPVGPFAGAARRDASCCLNVKLLTSATCRSDHQSAIRSPPANCALWSVYSNSSIFTPFGSLIHAW